MDSDLELTRSTAQNEKPDSQADVSGISEDLRSSWRNAANGNEAAVSNKNPDNNNKGWRIGPILNRFLRGRGNNTPEVKIDDGTKKRLESYGQASREADSSKAPGHRRVFNKNETSRQDPDFIQSIDNAGEDALATGEGSEPGAAIITDRRPEGEVGLGGLSPSSSGERWSRGRNNVVDSREPARSTDRPIEAPHGSASDPYSGQNRVKN